ncbi:hypothetical protein [Streptomyces africanus]|uniref:hypothetical protein n=1 Tax=Streptomyces africanus TaxID=231024 RepID=UPI000A396278|nr:hypothetical protein [Streptomyces africanus]
MAEPAATPLSHSIELALTGQPDVKNKYGSGQIRPERVVFYYLADRTNAHLHGSWIREDGEQTDAPVDQLYRHDDDWPDWLTALARKHAPAAAPQHVYRVSEIRDGAVRRVHGYHASLQGAFGYCEIEERKKPLIDSVRFELFAVPGGTQWLIHEFYGPKDDLPETSDFVISQHAVIPGPDQQDRAQGGDTK